MTVPTATGVSAAGSGLWTLATGRMKVSRDRSDAGSESQ